MIIPTMHTLVGGLVLLDIMPKMAGMQYVIIIFLVSHSSSE